ncbi:peptide chain release factor N(5)-glutamine methyltransferase [Aquimarina rhabdastrellae]
MTLQELRTQFIAQLTPLYGEEEATTFFYWLTEAFLEMRRVDVAIAFSQELTSIEEERFNDATAKLLQYIPIQYIVGKTSFYGLEFNVNEHVLIPRPETEELVDWIIKDVRKQSNQEIKILDIGTGSGCIAISLANELPQATVSGIDVSEQALTTARVNAKENNVEVKFIQQDILNTEGIETYDIIVSNPPYVRDLEKEEIKQNVLAHEPHLALFVADDNALIFYRKITALAKESLTKEGSLYFEINQYLGKETKEMIEAKGFEKVSLKKDFFGNHRMIKATLK